MLGNYEEKIADAQEVFNQILKSLSGELQNREIHEVEEELFRSVLKIGHSLLGAFLEKKGTGKDIETDLPYHKSEKWNYISIFGDIDVSNAYFWKKGNKGISPIKKELNLPKQHFSYLLQKWTQMFCIDISHEKSRKNIKEIFGIDIWSGQTESINKSASKSVDSFYENRKEQEQTEPILVVQVDGKGIIMRENLKKEVHGQRQKKGEKNGKKKMSTVTAVYGTERNIRSADDIIRGETGSKTRSLMVLDKKKGVIPQNKVVRATLTGKNRAFQHMAKEVTLRDPEGKWEPPGFDADAEIRFLVDRELRKRGMTETSGNPDFLVAYLLGIDMTALKLKEDPETKIYNTEKIPKGALVIMLIDPESRRAIWIGKATAQPEEKMDMETRKKRLDYVITKMLKQLPS